MRTGSDATLHQENETPAQRARRPTMLNLSIPAGFNTNTTAVRAGGRRAHQNVPKQRKHMASWTTRYGVNPPLCPNPRTNRSATAMATAAHTHTALEPRGARTQAFVPDHVGRHDEGRLGGTGWRAGGGAGGVGRLAVWAAAGRKGAWRGNGVLVGQATTVAARERTVPHCERLEGAVDEKMGHARSPRR